MIVDIEKIKAEIERLKALNADEYLADKFAELRAEFEAKRADDIATLEKFVAICGEYEVVEEVAEAQPEENAEAEQIIEG